MSGTIKTINDILDELQTIIFRISQKKCIAMINSSGFIKIKPENIIGAIEIDNYVEIIVDDESELLESLASCNIITSEKIILAGKIIKVHNDAESKETYIEIYNPNGIYKNLYENTIMKMLEKVYKILLLSEKLATNTDLFFEFDIGQDQFFDECEKLFSGLKTIL